MTIVAISDRLDPSPREIDRACERFESAWRAGDAITIEEMALRSSPKRCSETLLRELIAVEIDLRREQGAAPTPFDYVDRFPWFSQQINFLFEDDSASHRQLEEDRRRLPGGWSGDTAEEIFVPGYQILEELGRGSMGIVYKARDLNLNRLVALKFIQADAPKITKRHFRHEARTIANLHHCGIVKIFGIGELEGQLYLILELFDGRGLNDWLDGLPQQQQWAALLVARIARTLDYAHQQGVIHRDIKPANVLLTFPKDPLTFSALDIGLPHQLDSGQLALSDVPMPVITDFGLAKQLFSNETISGKQTMFGTPSYMPPEQAEGRSFEATAASDIYSLGAVLYEMLAGRPPVEGDTPLEILRNVCRSTANPIRSLRPDVSRRLERICQQCLKKDPAERFATAGALADALHDYLAEECSSVSVVKRYDASQRRLTPAVTSGFSAMNRLIDRGLKTINLRWPA